MTNIQLRPVIESANETYFKAGETSFEGIYNYTEAELKAMSEKLAQRIKDKEKLDDELKEIKEGFKAKMSDVDFDIKQLADHITLKRARKNFVCRVRVNPETKEREYVDRESGEVVGFEPMKSGDEQRPLYQD